MKKRRSISVTLTLSQAIAVYTALSTRYATLDHYFEMIVRKFEAAIKADRSSQSKRGGK